MSTPLGPSEWTEVHFRSSASSTSLRISIPVQGIRKPGKFHQHVNSRWTERPNLHRLVAGGKCAMFRSLYTAAFALLAGCAANPSQVVSPRCDLFDDCFDRDRVRSFEFLDRDTVIVEVGPLPLSLPGGSRWNRLPVGLFRPPDVLRRRPPHLRLGRRRIDHGCLFAGFSPGRLPGSGRPGHFRG